MSEDRELKLENELEEQIDKWTKRLEEKLEGLEVKDKEENDEVEEFIENINAYYKDSKHFKEKEDLIRSFEALVWAWAILDTLEKMDKIES